MGSFLTPCGKRQRHDGPNRSAPGDVTIVIRLEARPALPASGAVSQARHNLPTLPAHCSLFPAFKFRYRREQLPRAHELPPTGRPLELHGSVPANSNFTIQHPALRADLSIGTRRPTSQFAARAGRQIGNSAVTTNKVRARVSASADTNIHSGAGRPISNASSTIFSATQLNITPKHCFFRIFPAFRACHEQRAARPD